jgi:hypothetical protein
MPQLATIVQEAKKSLALSTNHGLHCDGQTKEIDMKTWNLIWAPTAQTIATVEARTARAAVRKAPLPWRRFLGEIRAEVV